MKMKMKKMKKMKTTDKMILKKTIKKQIPKWIKSITINRIKFKPKF